MKSPVTSITDEQLAEIERFLSFGGSTLKIHAGPLRGLIARLRAAEADAARYRWLREQCGMSGSLTIAEVGSWELIPWSGDDIDAAIDTAMERNP
jgi:hypothetical protein